MVVQIRAMDFSYKMSVTLKPEGQLSKFLFDKNEPVVSSMVQDKGHRITVVLDKTPSWLGYEVSTINNNMDCRNAYVL